jgi:hypothetical protein
MNRIRANVGADALVRLRAENLEICEELVRG